MRNTLRKVMKRAWEIKKENVKNIFSMCLKMAWTEIKSVKETVFYGVKEWFLNKALNNNERFAFRVGDGAFIARETEKAVLVKNMTDWGMVSFWCPKSCLLTKEDIEREEKAFENGLKYNESLVEYAKNNGVKGVRIGMRTNTLIEKIKNAGLEVPARV